MIKALAVRRIQRDDQPVLILCGADDRGTMYAALDTADRIGWAQDANNPLQEVCDIDEVPYVKERAMSIYTMHRAYWESRFYDEEYWTRYLDMLARDRINSLVIIFGYENGGFLAPPYPYFFDVEEFPGVRMADITPTQQRRNLAAMNRLVEMAHARGVMLTLGIWDHIYRGRVQAGGIEWAGQYADGQLPSTVHGVTAENLNRYTITALKKLLREIPNLDGLQFRMHGESGLKHSEMDGFWREVFRTMRESDPDMRFDARAKGLLDSVIDSGVELEVPLRICTKYWMEQMGPPPRLRRPAALSAPLPDALAHVVGRHVAHSAVGRPGICPAVCTEHLALRQPHAGGERTALHQDGGAASRPDAVRSAETRLPLLRL